MEDKDRDLFLLDLSSFPSLQNQNSSSSVSVPLPNESVPSTPSSAEKDTQIQSATSPLQVYSRSKETLVQPTRVLNSELNAGVNNVEVTSNSKDYENNMLVVDDDLPIAIRKGVRKCTQRTVYQLSHFVSYEKLSTGHKSFLSTSTL